MATDTLRALWQGKQFIAGEWREPSTDTFENRNPARFEQLLGVYPRGTAADADQAVAAARRAFGPWRRTSRIKRGELFDRLAHLIQRDVDSLAAVLARESGKIL